MTGTGLLKLRTVFQHIVRCQLKRVPGGEQRLHFRIGNGKRRSVDLRLIVIQGDQQALGRSR
ncbi:hypothetical protein D3C72_2220950 [compost metagenome]